MIGRWLLHGWRSRPALAGERRQECAFFERLYLLQSVEETLRWEIARRPRLETGGVLVGFTDSHLNAVVVTAASGPGPKAHHGPFTFNRDREFCQAFLDRYAAATSRRVDFVGEWHKHPEPDPRPSDVDRSTYRALASNRNARTPRPVVLIAGTESIRQDDGSVEGYTHVNGFIFRADGEIQRSIRWLADDAYADLRLDGGGRS